MSMFDTFINSSFKEPSIKGCSSTKNFISREQADVQNLSSPHSWGSLTPRPQARALISLAVQKRKMYQISFSLHFWTVWSAPDLWFGGLAWWGFFWIFFFFIVYLVLPPGILSCVPRQPRTGLANSTTGFAVYNNWARNLQSRSARCTTPPRQTQAPRHMLGASGYH